MSTSSSLVSGWQRGDAKGSYRQSRGLRGGLMNGRRKTIHLMLHAFRTCREDGKKLLPRTGGVSEKSPVLRGLFLVRCIWSAGHSILRRAAARSQNLRRTDWDRAAGALASGDYGWRDGLLVLYCPRPRAARQWNGDRLAKYPQNEIALISPAKRGCSVGGPRECTGVALIPSESDNPELNNSNSTIPVCRPPWASDAGAWIFIYLYKLMASCACWKPMQTTQKGWGSPAAMRAPHAARQARQGVQGGNRTRFGKSQ